MFFLQTVYDPCNNKLINISENNQEVVDFFNQKYNLSFLNSNEKEFYYGRKFKNFGQYCNGRLDIKTMDFVKETENFESIKKYTDRFSRFFIRSNNNSFNGGYNTNYYVQSNNAPEIVSKRVLMNNNPVLKEGSKNSIHNNSNNNIQNSSSNNIQMQDIQQQNNELITLDEVLDCLFVTESLDNKNIITNINILKSEKTFKSSNSSNDFILPKEIIEENLEELFDIVDSVDVVDKVLKDEGEVYESNIFNSENINELDLSCEFEYDNDAKSLEISISRSPKSSSYKNKNKTKVKCKANHIKAITTTNKKNIKYYNYQYY